MRNAGEENYASLSFGHCTLPFSGTWDSSGRAPVKEELSPERLPSFRFSGGLVVIKASFLRIKSETGDSCSGIGILHLRLRTPVRSRPTREQPGTSLSQAIIRASLSVLGEQHLASFKMPDAVLNGVHERRDKCTRQMHLSNSQAC